VRIVHELREKGIAENLIRAALPNIREMEQHNAREVWRKKFGVAPADAKERERQVRFLMGRGFAAEVIYKMLRDTGREGEA
jgi:regulatory protein